MVMSVVLKRHHDVETVQNLPVTPKMTPNGEKPDPFSTCLLTGCVAHIYMSEWVPQGKNNNSTSAMTSPLLKIFQKLALKPIIKVQYKNQPQKFIL